MIEASDITKSYGTTIALNGVSFNTNPSEVYGFIGPDGAGKTTLFRIITTLLIPDSGRISVLGYDPVKEYKKIRLITGYMPGRFSLYHDLSVEENLNFYAGVFGVSVKENYHLISAIYSHIEPFRKRRAGDLSGGMKQKLALSCALIHNPRLLVLDEPTTGVDAVSRTEFWDMLAGIRESGVSVIVSTPYMDEAMRCDRVSLMDEGRILTTGKPGDIKDQFQGKLFSVKHSDLYKTLTTLKQYRSSDDATLFGDSVHLTTDNSVTPGAIMEFLNYHNLSESTVAEAKPGIEDRFLQLIQERKDD